jgi:hypothetical protein
LLRIAKAYIEEHFRKDIGLAELASLTKLSQSRFARGFRISTGVPPCTWTLRRRVEAAEQLLLSTDMPLSCIAIQVGFADQSHLTKVFRRNARNREQSEEFERPPANFSDLAPGVIQKLQSQFTGLDSIALGRQTAPAGLVHGFDSGARGGT